MSQPATSFCGAATEKKKQFLRSPKISYAERALETTKILGFS